MKSRLFQVIEELLHKPAGSETARVEVERLIRRRLLDGDGHQVLAFFGSYLDGDVVRPHKGFGPRNAEVDLKYSRDDARGRSRI
jgi:hypothetical protein